MENQNQQVQSCGEEIDLRETVKIFLNRKKFIFGLAAIGAAAAFILSNYLAKDQAKNQVEAVIEVGTLAAMGDAKDGLNRCGPLLVESPAQIKEKIDRGVYTAPAKEKSGVLAPVKLEATEIKNTNLVSLTAESKNSKDAQDYLAAACDLIILDHRQKSQNFAAALKTAPASETLVIRPAVETESSRVNSLLNAIVAGVFFFFASLFWVVIEFWWRGK